MPTSATDRARDLLSALEILKDHRNEDPAAYRAVHAAATGALAAVHDDLIDPRSGDLEEGLATYGELARQLRTLPQPTAGQRQPTAWGGDPLKGLLGRRFGPAAGVESWLSEVATGISPNLEQAVRDGLRDLFAQGEPGDPRA